jgi:uncharacterized membrane protein
MIMLLGLMVLGLGLARSWPPLIVVTAASLSVALGAGLPVMQWLEVLGGQFSQNRFVALAWLVLPLIGVLERHGLQHHARAMMQRLYALRAPVLLILYLLIRQLGAALGLASLGGQAQMVRPLVLPMAQAALERDGPCPPCTLQQLAAHAAAVDNIGLFFGEDVFMAMGSILLAQAVLVQQGLAVEPWQLAMWSIPTAVAASAIHGTRLLFLGRAWQRDMGSR